MILANDRNRSKPISGGCQSGVCFAPDSGPTSGSSERLLRAKSRLKLNEMGFDRSLVPFESYPRHIGYMQKPVLYLVGPLENWIGPVLPL